MVASSSPSPRATARRRPARVSGEEREQAILATLEQLLADRSLHDLSIDDIARGAGISRPTFYFYFASKEAALLALLETLVEQVLEAQQEAPALLEHDRDGAWRLAIGASYASWMAHRHVIRAAAQVRATDPAIGQLWTGLLEVYVQQTAETIEAERERGAAPPGLPARDLAVCLNRMNERIYETTLGDDAPTVDDDRVVDSLVEVWLRTIYGTSSTADG